MTDTPSKTSSARSARYPIVLALAAVLALSFGLYSQPDVVVMLAEQLWACF